MRAKPVLRIAAGLTLAVLLTTPLACGSPATPTTAPTAAPAAQPTVTVAPPPSPTAAPTSPPATPTVEAKPTAAPVAAPSPTSSSGFGSLKPITPTAGTQPGETGLKPIPDTLKPITALTATAPANRTPTPASKPGQPAGQPKPITKLQVQPTPTVARKGVANPNVDPQKYLIEMATDLEKLADAVSEMGEVVNAYQEGDVSEDEVVASITKQQATIRDLYVREVQRDYPPQLKEIDDYYVESMRSATRFMDSLVMALQTGDLKHLNEAGQHADKFQYFLNELVKRLGG